MMLYCSWKATRDAGDINTVTSSVTDSPAEKRPNAVSPPTPPTPDTQPYLIISGDWVRRNSAGDLAGDGGRDQLFTPLHVGAGGAGGGRKRVNPGGQALPHHNPQRAATQRDPRSGNARLLGISARSQIRRKDGENRPHLFYFPPTKPP